MRLLVFEWRCRRNSGYVFKCPGWFSVWSLQLGFAVTFATLTAGQNPWRLCGVFYCGGYVGSACGMTSCIFAVLFAIC